MLVGHGTRDQLGTQQFFQLGEKLADLLSPLPVESCLLEFQIPTIADAWQTLADAGVEHVRVAPLLLFAAGHAKQDIPAAIERCRAKALMTLDQSRPISRHADLISLVRKRIGETLHAGAIRDDERTALVMVGRGNRDPCAQADMRVLSEIIGRGFTFGRVSTAFYAMAEPPLPEVLDRIAESGRYRHIVIHPHLLFAGRLYDAIGKQISDAAERHPAARFHLGHYLGPEIEIAQAIAARVSRDASAAGCARRS